MAQELRSEHSFVDWVTSLLSLCEASRDARPSGWHSIHLGPKETMLPDASFSAFQNGKRESIYLGIFGTSV